MIEIPETLRIDALAGLKTLFDNSSDCTKIFDVEGRLMAINPAGVALLGCAHAGELVGRLWSEYLPACLGELAEKVFEEARGGQTVRLSTRLPPGAAGLYCDITALPLRTTTGEITAILAITRDVTALVAARKNAEAREKSPRQKTAALRAAGQLARLGAWELDVRRRTLYLSDEVWTFLGQTPRLVPIDEALLYLEPDDVEILRTRVTDSRRAGVTFAMDVRIRHADPQRSWARVVGEADEAAGILRGALQDVTEARRAELELISARDAAEAGTRAQSDFLANISHEIRTPLHGILGMAQVMGQHPLSSDQAERLGIIRQSGDILMALLNDILDLSKIEAGMLVLDERTFDIGAALNAACAPFHYLAGQKDIVFDLDIAEAARGCWRGDDLRLRQIISNLVSNAVKFTDAGRVLVTVNHDSQALIIVVADTGVGIDPVQVERLFQKFTQGDSAITRQYGGTGLGLSICEQLAELMGGTITVDAQPGHGSRFKVCVPLARAPEPFAPIQGDAAQALSAGARILAAEDNKTNQLILRSMIAPLDVMLTLVEDGEMAVLAFERDSFDLVLMDIQMPRLNGVDATRRIRALEVREHRPRTPILALSANVMAHQVADYLAAGMDGVIEKPIDIGSLFGAISDALVPAPAPSGMA